MAQTNKGSNKLTNLDLSIQISLSGLSFCILNKDANTIIEIKELHFEKRLNPLEVLDELKQLFSNETILNNHFDNVTIVHDNELSTLVPESLFNKNYLADYLKFNSKILKSDFIAYDSISENNSFNVYVPYVNINNYIYDKFGSFIYKHVSSVLIKSILQIEKDSTLPKVYVHVGFKHFEIIIVENNQLVLYNTFAYNSKEDFIYYILFVAEQLNLNPETLDMILIGDIEEHEDLYNIAYKYIRNINFGNRNDDFEYINKPKTNYSNFILLNSFLMRIISGLYKSRKIIAPKNLPVRPTTDMAKESLFNIINNLYYFDDITVLDLFAGTGNISYEFASRGTEQITCVDQNFGCIKFINQTAEKFEMPIQTIKSDVFKFLEKSTMQSNLIFADPPYSFTDEQFARIPELIFQNNLLLDDGLLIVEHSKHTDLSQLQNFAYSKSYGGNVFSFFES